MKISELKAVVEGSKLKAPFTDHEDCDDIIVDADGFDLIDGEFPNEQTKDMVIAVLNHAPAFLELWEACDRLDELVDLDVELKTGAVGQQIIDMKKALQKLENI